MAKPTTFGKKENEKKKQARRQAKQNRKEERKLSGKASSFDEMIAYVDEHGMITSTPPEERHNGGGNRARRYTNFNSQAGGSRHSERTGGVF